MPIHNVYKPIGWSALDAIQAFKKEFPDFADAPMTYAGRLDPMAEGVVLLLSNEERHDGPTFQKLTKTYKATFLLGVESDTYDCLGLVTKGRNVPEKITESQIKKFFLGTHVLPFPAYSSYRVKGKPLHYWANAERLDEITIPMKTMKVLDAEGIVLCAENAQLIKDKVIERVQKVRGSFRQQETIDRWNSIILLQQVTLINCTLTVTSGTYIRALAHEMGKLLGCGAVLYELQRTSIASYSHIDSIQLDK